MATIQGINIPGHYVVLMNAMPFHTYTLNSKKLRDRTEPSFVLCLKLNDHHTRNFIFGLRRIHPNGCNFKSKKKSEKTLLRIRINTIKGLFSHLSFRPLRSSPIYE